jgi:nucleotide-binding universal stress UspA family protein
MRILAATDFSTRSQRAVRRAGILARQAGAELLLLHVVNHGRAGSDEAEMREADRMLGEQVAAVPELAGVRARAIIRTGNPGEAILETAVWQSVNLIVMGAPRKRMFKAVGPTIRAVLQGLHPILIVKGAAREPYARALAPVDLSDVSAKALRSALALGLIDGADVTVVHAFAALAKGKMSQVGIVKERIADYVNESRSQAGHELAVFLAATGLQDRGWSARVAEGSPLHVITRSVRAVSPELLVMGTHSRSGLGKALLGSVTEEVLHVVGVDVLAVPPIRPTRPLSVLLQPVREELPQHVFVSAPTTRSLSVVKG